MTQIVTMLEINTNLSHSDILNAIDIITETIPREAMQNNRLAAAIIGTDPEEAQVILEANKNRMDAAEVLLQLSLDMLPNEDDFIDFYSVD